MDLQGLDQNGTPAVWATAADVQPIDRFPLAAGHTLPGLYVVDMRGQAVTVQIGTTPDPAIVTLAVMGCADELLTVRRGRLERQLLGLLVVGLDAAGGNSLSWTGASGRRRTQ